jgi:hypothetical protein
MCIDKHYFPTAFKVAKVYPLLKSGPLGKDNVNNYRPISVLTSLSKPLEKQIYKFALQHMKQYDLLTDCQSGFRLRHSCHTALCKIVDEFHRHINDDKICGALFIDFKKAFDMVDHDILNIKINAMKFHVNIGSILRSFLLGRQQVISFNNSFSDYTFIKTGVPQGSILGPLLFSIYINDLPLNLELTSCDLFADDCTIHTSNKYFDQLESSLQKDLDNIINWSQRNKMLLNETKTKSMCVTTSQKMLNMHRTDLRLHVGGTAIESVTHHKVLGIIIDQHLTFNQHVESLTKLISQKVHQLRKIKNYLNDSGKKAFYFSHIQSHTDYCSTVWDGCSADHLKKLNSLHRRSMKLISNKIFDQTDDLYRHLKLLPLKKHFLFNKAKLVHKILFKNAPSYLSKLLASTSRHSDRLKVLELPLPRTNLFKTSFCFSGRLLWNSLPDYLKKIKIPNSFNKEILLYLSFRPP